MPRIPRTRCVRLLELAPGPALDRPRLSFAAARPFTSSTCLAQEKSSSWIRGKLWKGEAPGPEDPYTQRPEEVVTSNLPDEALEAPPPRERIPYPVRTSRLTLPPKRTEAAAERAVLSNPDYVPATSLSELEEIPALKKWWDEPGHWGQESEFRGFTRAEKVQDGSVLEVYLRRAVVEMLALEKAGTFKKLSTKRWSHGGEAQRRQALAVTVRVTSGEATLKGDVAGLTKSLTKEEAVENSVPEHLNPQEAKEMTSTWDASWKQLALNDRRKFALRKRLYQLSGQLISDHRLSTVQNVQELLEAALATAKWKKEKLADVIGQSEEWKALPNVKVHSRRIGPIDREIAIGRWKVIEAELKKRNLPVSGRLDMPSHKEKDWILGRVA